MQQQPPTPRPHLKIMLRSPCCNETSNPSNVESNVTSPNTHRVLRLKIIQHQPANPFVWDGSDLGMLHPSSIIGSAMSVSKFRYWSLNIGGHKAICRVRSSRTTFPNIIDELKPVFGLPKVGTHRCTFGAKNYVLCRVNTDPTSGEIVEDTLLSQIVYDSKLPNGAPMVTNLFVAQVQELFIFRELLGVTASYEKTVAVRISRSGKHYRAYPLSFTESKMDPTLRERVIPETVIKRWFGDTNVDKVVSRVLGINDRESLTSGLASLRTKIEQTVRRVDAQSIWVSVFIIERAMSRLLSLTAPPEDRTYQDRLVGADTKVPTIIPLLDVSPEETSRDEDSQQEQ